ncbi:Uncharacterized protein HZ326_1386 [Fusarium oxysporum f. sp. albedinis]|nr:Uncharacterized protein HZ326_1386 [Fusarium oxysporum f. sp. albedinis]
MQPPIGIPMQSGANQSALHNFWKTSIQGSNSVVLPYLPRLRDLPSIPSPLSSLGFSTLQHVAVPTPYCSRPSDQTQMPLQIMSLRDGRELAVLSLEDVGVLARYCAWPRRMAVPG